MVLVKKIACHFRRLKSLGFGVAMLPGELVDPEPAELPASLEDPIAFDTTFRGPGRISIHKLTF